MSFPFTLKFRLVSRKEGLKQLEKNLVTEMRGALGTIGKRLTASSESRMRRDTGESIKTLKTIIEGRGLNLSVIVYSTLLRAFIDAYGLRPGTRIPFGQGTRLNKWAERKIGTGEKTGITEGFSESTIGPKRVFSPVKVRRVVPRIEIVTPVKRIRVTKKTTGPVRAVARERAKNRAANRFAFLTAREIYHRGLKGSHWNKAALEANKGRLIRELKNAISRAVNKVRRG